MFININFPSGGKYKMISTAILTISDKGYNNQREDLTGPAIKDILTK